jgi:hypothetical protein
MPECSDLPAVLMAADHCVRYSVEECLADPRLPGDSTGRCLDGLRSQLACQGDCLAARCSAAAQADLRSGLRSAVAHFRRFVAAELPGGLREPF